MTMPMRMASGEASVWELTLSLTLMVCAVYLLIRLAGKIYSGALLRSGAKVKLRDAWRAAES
jgi:ABC-2 type transport system permease protein